MNTLALVFMISVQVIVTGITVYYFVKVLRAKPKPEPDSFIFNDDEPR
jgi:hypothetical protein